MGCYGKGGADLVVGTSVQKRVCVHVSWRSICVLHTLARAGDEKLVVLSSTQWFTLICCYFSQKLQFCSYSVASPVAARPIIRQCGGNSVPTGKLCHWPYSDAACSEWLTSD